MDVSSQIANRQNDYELHVATGVRRLAILDTRKGHEKGAIGELER